MEHPISVSDQEQWLLMRTIFSDHPIPMMIIDREGRVIDMNNAQENLSHVKLEKVLGTFFHESWSVLMGQQNFDEYYWNLLKHRIPYSVVFDDFKPQFFDLTVSGIAYGVPLDAGKHFLMIHDVGTDIRTNKKTLDMLNNQLSQRSTFLRSLLDSSPHAVVTIDRNGFIQTANRTTEELFGQSKGELLWKPISLLFEDQSTRLSIPDLAASKSGLLTRCRKTNGEVFPVKLKLNRIRKRDEESASYLVILEDQTYEAAIEHELSERLKFEMILSELFATFINPNPDDVGGRIDIALSRIGQQLDLDRCYLTLYDGEIKTFHIAYSWANEGIQPARPGTRLETSTWAYRMLTQKKSIQLNDLSDIPENAGLDRQYGKQQHPRSLLYLPLVSLDTSPIGALGMEQVRYQRDWNHELVTRIHIIKEVLLNVIQKRQSETKLKQAFDEIKLLKDRLETERNYLLDEIRREHNLDEIIGNSRPLQRMLDSIEKVAPTDATVLIMGETGTGKELIARSIHGKSLRNDRPLIKVNCASLPLNLIESELFGHEKGAFTGAHTRRKGRFETADGATLFLDEVGELPLETQAKLLRTLQEGEFERLGSSKTIAVNIRIIAATNRNLEKEVAAGRFRKDLWYRLNVFPIVAPPLRERKGDIPLLVNWTVRKFEKKMGRKIKGISLDAIKTLEDYSWPGNIRELQNVIERAVIKSRDGFLELSDNLDADILGGVQEQSQTLAENERNHILKTLDSVHWKISGKKGAASVLGVPSSTLRSRMKKLQILRPH